MKKGRKTLLMPLLISAIIIAGMPCAVFAEDEVACRQCDEILSEADVVYNDSGDAACVYCDEILSQEILDRLFPNESDAEENAYICPECESVIADEEAEYDESGEIICPYCAEAELETDNSEYGEADEFSEIVLNASEWAQGEMNAAYDKGLIPAEMVGVVLSTDVTREQFAAIAVKLYEKITAKDVGRSTDGIPFADCSADGAYTGYVAAAYRLGITNGISSTVFAPQQIISREQLATMIFRVIARAQNDGVSPKSLITGAAIFADEALISDYAKESVIYMAQRGIIKGMTETEFVPAGVATKEQAIIISNRIADTLY